MVQVRTGNSPVGHAVVGVDDRWDIRAVAPAGTNRTRPRTRSWKYGLENVTTDLARRGIARRARHAATEWAARQGVPQAALMEWQMALGEVVTNAATHALRATRLQVTVSIVPGRLRFVVADDGRKPVDARAWLTAERRAIPRAMPDAVGLEDCHRGWLCIDENLDRWDCVSSDSGTRVIGEKTWVVAT